MKIFFPGATQVYVSKLDGSPLAQFGRRGATPYRCLPGEMFEPSGVTIDGARNVLIGDSKNDRIQVKLI